MMKAGRCIKVFNPYDWLPGHGENSVQTFMDGDLTVLVLYDGENGGERGKKIIFKKVSSFHRSSCPGVNMLNISHIEMGKENVSITDLVEYPDSEAARAWNEYWQSYRPGIRTLIKHYRWFFLSENVVLEIFAESIQLEEGGHFSK